MYKRYVGIEIGTRQVKMVPWEENHLYREVAEPLPDELACDRTSVSMERMAGFLKDTAQKYHIGGNYCCLVLPDSVVYTKRLKVPAMTVEQLKLNLPYEFYDYIPNKSQPYVFDYAVINTEHQQNRKPASMDLMAAAAPRNVIEEYRHMLRLAGWKMKTAAPAAFAYSNLIREYEKRQAIVSPGDYCFVDLGYHATKILMFHGSGLQASRELETGCAQLVEAVENEENVDSHMAETYIKENFHNVWESRACYEIYEAVGVDIRRTLEFYYYRNPDKRLKHLLFCGGGTLIESFWQTISEYAGLEPDFAGRFLFRENLEKGFSDTILSPAAAGITICEEKTRSGIWNQIKERRTKWRKHETIKTEINR